MDMTNAVKHLIVAVGIQKDSKEKSKPFYLVNVGTQLDFASSLIINETLKESIYKMHQESAKVTQQLLFCMQIDNGITARVG